MLNKLNRIFYILDNKQKKVIIFLQFFIVIISILEIISVISIGPYISIISNYNDFSQNKIVLFLYNFFNFEEKRNFILYYSIFIIIIFSISTILTIFFTWFSIFYSNKITANIANKLFKFYLNQNYLYHTYNSPSFLTSKIINDVNIVSGGVLQSILMLNAKLIISILLILSIFIYNPKVTIITSSIFILIYFLFLIIIRTKVREYGKSITKTNSKKVSNINDSLGGIKEIIIYKLQDYFENSFKELNYKILKGQTFITAASYLPKYIIELIAVILIISASIIIVVLYQFDLNIYLSLLTIYAIAGFKLLPNFQSIYNNYTRFIASFPSFEKIEKDLNKTNILNINFRNNKENFSFKKITLSNVSFSYPNKKDLILNKISLEINKNMTYGIIGSTGSGKSTLINIIMCLFKPTSGFLKINDHKQDQNNIDEIQRNISYVSQNIFLTNNSILENVCFGEEVNNIDLEKVIRSLKISQIYDFVMSLPEKLYTKVGERGVQLSGGQKQRIAIARALYFDKNILILDEATSSIDNNTEKKIISEIYKLKNKTIIMIAHRVNTIRHCDHIIVLENGKISDIGNFSYLSKKNKFFKEINNYQ